jgi:PadR family transcriptional regulator PadR
MLPKELVAASTRPLILSLLAKGESYGYELIQKVRAASEGEIEWTEGMLYPVLHRLELEGLVSTAWKTGETARSRKYYKLTGSGKKALKVDQERWIKVHQTLTLLWNQLPAQT